MKSKRKLLAGLRLGPPDMRSRASLGKGQLGAGEIHITCLPTLPRAALPASLHGEGGMGVLGRLTSPCCEQLKWQELGKGPSVTLSLGQELEGRRLRILTGIWAHGSPLSTLSFQTEVSFAYHRSHHLKGTAFRGFWYLQEAVMPPSTMTMD